MDGKESGLSSFYHHHQQQQQHPNHPTTTTSSVTNGIFSTAHYSSEPPPPPLVFPPSFSGRPSAAPAPVAETIKRKRGRPRKYGPGGSGDGPPPASASAKKPPSAASPSLPLSSPPPKKESSSSKKSQLDALGNAGQGFTPHVITVAAGEDVAQKIMSFMQQRKRAVCILSASGSISNASLRQPATLGGNVTYEGRFEILSLSGSYLHSEMEGASSRTGGLSVCLSGADGRIIGGGVGGPLKAAGPVQVIAGSFLIDMNKDSSSVVKAEATGPVIGTMVSPFSFRSTPDSSARISVRGHDDHHNIGASGFMVQSRAMHVMHRSNADMELTERTDGHRGTCQSHEDGDD